MLFLYKVRNLAKLALFFSLSFAILFIVATGLRFMVIRIEWVRALSHEQEAVLAGLITAARWALSLALYGGILLSISYAVRQRVFMPSAILCVVALSICFVFGIGQGLENWEYVPPAQSPISSLGTPGLILANTAQSGTILVLLEGAAKPDGARVVATPGRSLLYQAEFAGRNTNLPPAPFRDECPWFLESLAIDLRLNAENLQLRFNEGWLSFLMYAGALSFLLCSFIFVQNFSAWPLANIFLGCLVFRGVLALEIFFNSPEMQDVFDSFLQNRLPLSWAVPSIFAGAGVLIYLYSFLVYLTKGRKDDAI